MKLRHTALVLLIASTVHARNYELADLDALAKQSSWQELLDHAEDIAPSQRTARWSQLVEEAAHLINHDEANAWVLKHL